MYKQTIRLIVSYIGYGNQTVEVDKAEFKGRIEFTMQPIVIEEDSMMISYGVRRESFPKRIWRGLKNIFKKGH